MAICQAILEKKWGILIKKESESLIFTGLKIPRVYFNKLGEKSGGIFTVVSDGIENIETKKELFETNKAEVKYAEGEELTDTIQHRFKEIHSKITQFKQTAQKLKRKLHVNSKEYEQMERKMKELLNYSKGLKDKLIKGETISEK